MLRNHEPGCTQTELFPVLLLPPVLSCRKRSRFVSKARKTASDFRPRHRLLPLLEQRSLGRSLRHGSAFRVGIRGSERYRTLLQLLGRTLRRYQERFKAGGLSALARPRGRPQPVLPCTRNFLARPHHSPPQNQGDEQSLIAGRLGLSEKRPCARVSVGSAGNLVLNPVSLPAEARSQ